MGKSSNIKFSRERFIRFLEFNGFGRFRIDNSYIYVHSNKNRIKEVTKTEIKDFVSDYIKQLPLKTEGLAKEHIHSALMRSANILFSNVQLEFLPYFKNNIIRDTKDKAYIFFKNKIIEISKDKINEINYHDFDKRIWEKKIINRNFSLQDNFEDAEFFLFMKNVCRNDNDRIDSLKSITGYLQHSYKNEGNAFAIIFMDEKISKDGAANGRTGKSLYAKGIAKIKNVHRIDGKNFKFDKSFAFQQVSIDTDIINFDDVRNDFNFERLLSIITDDMQIEKKYMNEITLPFSDSPKFLVSTNYVIKGRGASFEGRKIEFEFSDYYNLNHKPEHEFGHQFFHEWDEVEWNKLDNLMVHCVQYYLKNGLIDYKKINVEKKRLIIETAEEFASFCEDYLDSNINGCIEKEFNKKGLFNTFLDNFPDFENKLWQRTFTKWLRIYADYKKLDSIEENRNSNCYIKFMKK